jgi:hypothetical protein
MNTAAAFDPPAGQEEWIRARKGIDVQADEWIRHGIHHRLRSNATAACSVLIGECGKRLNVVASKFAAALLARTTLPDEDVADLAVPADT